MKLGSFHLIPGPGVAGLPNGQRQVAQSSLGSDGREQPQNGGNLTWESIETQVTCETRSKIYYLSFLICLNSPLDTSDGHSLPGSKVAFPKTPPPTTGDQDGETAAMRNPCTKAGKHAGAPDQRTSVPPGVGQVAAGVSIMATLCYLPLRY